MFWGLFCVHYLDHIIGGACWNRTNMLLDLGIPEESPGNPIFVHYPDYLICIWKAEPMSPSFSPKSIVFVKFIQLRLDDVVV